MFVRVKIDDAPPEGKREQPKGCNTERLWSVLDMVKAYMKAKASGYGASAEVIATRKASCEQCTSYCRAEGLRWCGACGCGSKRKEAIIEGGEGRSKLEFVQLMCPKKQPGFSNEVIHE